MTLTSTRRQFRVGRVDTVGRVADIIKGNAASGAGQLTVKDEAEGRSRRVPHLGLVPVGHVSIASEECATVVIGTIGVLHPNSKGVVVGQ